MKFRGAQSTSPASAAGQNGTTTREDDLAGVPGDD
jgi:hypothetical protein